MQESRHGFYRNPHCSPQDFQHERNSTWCDDRQVHMGRREAIDCGRPGQLRFADQIQEYDYETQTEVQGVSSANTFISEEGECEINTGETALNECSDFDAFAGSDYGCDPCPVPENCECPLPVQCQPMVCPGSGDSDESESAFNNEETTKRELCGEAISRINEAIKAITPFTVLDEFMVSVADFTADKGETMFDLMSTEVNNFKELIQEIYASRNDNVSSSLRADQQNLKKKYDKWTKDLIKKTDATIEKLKTLVPRFDVRAYQANPHTYVQDLINELHRKEVTKEANASGRGVALNNQFDSPEKAMRIGMHKRAWFVRQAEIIECENEDRMVKLNEMMAQLACLSESLATSNKKMAAYNRQLENHAICLRNKLAQNEDTIICLMDEVAAAGAENPQEQQDDCEFIKPDAILTKFVSGYDYC